MVTQPGAGNPGGEFEFGFVILVRLFCSFDSSERGDQGGDEVVDRQTEGGEEEGDAEFAWFDQDEEEAAVEGE